MQQKRTDHVNNNEVFEKMEIKTFPYTQTTNLTQGGTPLAFTARGVPLGNITTGGPLET